jgi:hypothetical protein
MAMEVQSAGMKAVLLFNFCFSPFRFIAPAYWREEMTGNGFDPSWGELRLSEDSTGHIISL